MLSNRRRKTNPGKRVLATLTLCLLMLSGCNTWTGDPVVEFIGEVTLDGKVLTNAMVVFVPVRLRNDTGQIIPLAFGKTDGTGRFELTSEEQKGVLLGRYRVLIFRDDVVNAELQDKATVVSGQSLNSKQNDATELINNKLAALLNEPRRVQAIGASVPSRYNLHSELEYVVEMPVGNGYPKFALSSE